MQPASRASSRIASASALLPMPDSPEMSAMWQVALLRALEEIEEDGALGGAPDDAAVGERGELVRAPLAGAMARRRRRRAARLERLTRGARRLEALLGALGQQPQHPQLEIGRDAFHAVATAAAGAGSAAR